MSLVPATGTAGTRVRRATTAAVTTTNAQLPAATPATQNAPLAPRVGGAPTTTRAARLAQLAASYQSKRVTHIELDHKALASNVRAIRDRIGPDRALCAVVKANAYGHGAVEVARVALAAGADRLAVATVAEGAELRAAGIDAPILVLGYSAPEEAADVVALELTATIFSRESADALARAAEQHGVKARVHVKVNTGMNRIGVRPEDAVALVEHLAKSRALDVEGIFTHFPNADADLPQTRAQLKAFTDVVDALDKKGLRPKIAHAANSDATFALPEAHLDMVRCGTALYGFMPTVKDAAGKPVIKDVLSWKTRVGHVNALKDGEGVSYGHTWRAQGDRTVAVIPVGWADGLEGGNDRWREVLVNGKRAPIVGAICMDQAIIDVTDAGPVKPGDEVVLIGRQGDLRITAQDAATWLGGVHPVVVTGKIRQRSPSSTFDETWTLRRAGGAGERRPGRFVEA